MANRLAHARFAHDYHAKAIIANEITNPFVYLKEKCLKGTLAVLKSKRTLLGGNTGRRSL